MRRRERPEGGRVKKTEIEVKGCEIVVSNDHTALAGDDCPFYSSEDQGFCDFYRLPIGLTRPGFCHVKRIIVEEEA
jgi:hypothetical protein